MLRFFEIVTVLIVSLVGGLLLAGAAFLLLMGVNFLYQGLG